MRSGSGNGLTIGDLPTLAPLRTMLDDPIGQSSLEADVAPGFLRFDPLVLEDLLALGLEFPVQRRILE